jgi:fatty acid desaturase
VGESTQAAEPDGSSPSELVSAGLRDHVQREKIKLPRELVARSRAWTLLHGVQPFLYLAVSILVARFAPWPVWSLLPLHLLLLLAAHRSFQTQVHDLSHRVFSENLALNDLLGNLFAAGWTGTHVQSYRSVHFKHHAHNGSAQDPEYISLHDVQRDGGVLRYVLRYAFGLHTLRLFRKYYAPKPAQGSTVRVSLVARLRRLVATKWAIVLAQTTLLLAFTFLAGAPYLYAVWLYLAVSWSPLLSGLRFMVEHPGRSSFTVSTRSAFVERVYFAPLGFNYHFEHHVWPTIPPYRLRRVHAHLHEVGYYERHPATQGDGFVSALLAGAKQPTPTTEPNSLSR